MQSMQPEMTEIYPYLGLEIRLLIDELPEEKGYVAFGNVVKNTTSDVEVFRTNKLETTTFSGSVSWGFQSEPEPTKAAAVKAGIQVGKQMIDREFE